MTADAVGGVWHYATELAAALVPLGVETLLAVIGPPPSPEDAAAAAAVPGLRLVDTGLPLDWLCDGPDPVIAAGQAVAALAARECVDLVQLNMPSLGAAARFPVPVVAVAHGCLASWWDAARGTPLPDPYRWQAPLVAAGLAAADAVVAPSACFAATVARLYDLPTLPFVVHNGRQTQPVSATPPAAHAFTAGRLWDQAKATPLLDAAAARLSVPFRAAGPLQAPHGERVAIEHMTALGRLDAATLAGELALRPMFVSAACFEPFGLAVLEAAGAGCALVLSGIGTFRELWTGAALIVDENTPQAYAAAVERLIADPALRAQLGEAARVRAGRYTPAAMASAMTAIYARPGERRQAAA